MTKLICECESHRQQPTHAHFAAKREEKKIEQNKKKNEISL